MFTFRDPQRQVAVSLAARRKFEKIGYLRQTSGLSRTRSRNSVHVHSSTMATADPAMLTEDGLRRELQNRGLSIEGNYQELRERLVTDFIHSLSLAEATVGATSGEPGATVVGSRESAPSRPLSPSAARGTRPRDERPRFFPGGEDGGVPSPDHHSSPFRNIVRLPNAGPAPPWGGTRSIIDLLKKWDLGFAGRRGEDALGFLARLDEAREIVPVSEAELLPCLPLMFSGIALVWYRGERGHLRTYRGFTKAFVSRFGDPDLQFTIREELIRRTQGEDEPVSDYLTCLRALLDRIDPPYVIREQLDYAHRNMHPSLQRIIPRSQFVTFEQLERIATRAERSEQADRYYRPPPSPERSAFPELAYHRPRSSPWQSTYTAFGARREGRDEPERSRYSRDSGRRDSRSARTPERDSSYRRDNRDYSGSRERRWSSSRERRNDHTREQSREDSRRDPRRDRYTARGSVADRRVHYAYPMTESIQPRIDRERSSRKFENDRASNYRSRRDHSRDSSHSRTPERGNYRSSANRSPTPSRSVSPHASSRDSSRSRDDGCWNCGQKGHRAIGCTGPKTVFCYNCGKKGVTKLDEHDCQGNPSRSRR